ncbi:hypothetical protein OPV22_022240 [Ensete ventricosum]|uniref:Uncharacterized protein n=1 Tax=Ensete ventricosum TaxID=4639 RepID=A0AAV8QU37_ENSVE|nr:hypothetical protein OPV22_022240 [Ensete ventricosum]RWW08927.1 hypothetical protein GW17_00027613 [Ensete ventricosum]RWW79418.1 hypothetical protein BHE74_00012293 [Ensete ventricosum]RZR89891.1 hypothetical protein BHM03_00017697 [Ensete ventricosum]
MSGFTDLGFALIIILSLSLLGLAAELIYLLHRRRRRWLLHQSTADPELGGGPSSGELLLHVLCFKPRSRVEPSAHPSAASIPASPKPPADPADADPDSDPDPDPEEECDFDRWRTTYLGPSRALYTINEEEEGDDEDLEEDDETPFATPCASPGFYTPSPSPPRKRV